MTTPQPAQPVARPIYYTYAHPILYVLAVISFIIALVVAAGWVHEPAKIDDVLVFLSLGSALFAAGHVW